MIDKITSSALTGIQRGMKGMHKNAQDIASAPVKASAQTQSEAAPDLVRSMVELKQHALQVKANASVLQTAGDTIGALLDVKA